MSLKNTHGGKRKGAGRKKSATNAVLSVTIKETLKAELIDKYGSKNITILTKDFINSLQNMKTININGIDFVIQSFLKNDFCYLVSPKMSSIRINFIAQNKNEQFESNQKTNKNWFDFVEKIEVEKIEVELAELFHCS